MRLAPLAVIAVASAASCFQPNVKNRGFACDGNYPGACPSGFTCINHFCDDGSGGGPSADLAAGNGSDGGGGDGGGMMDMAQTTPLDFAQPPAAPDLAQPPPDLATTCVHDKCATGAPLDPTCDPCVNMVCSGDPYCCNIAWDVDCKAQVNSVCGVTCH
jgi:hypothetical protein